MPRGLPRRQVEGIAPEAQQEDPAQEGIAQTWWLEIGPYTSVIQLIHSLQRAQDRFPKGFFEDRVTCIMIDGEEHELNEGSVLEARIDYRRPETDEERVFRQEQERQQAIVDRERRRQEFLALREEFGDDPQPEPPNDIVFQEGVEGQVIQPVLDEQIPPMPNGVRNALLQRPGLQARWNINAQIWEVVENAGPPEVVFDEWEQQALDGLRI